jgi:hypothetical protein
VAGFVAALKFRLANDRRKAATLALYELAPEQQTRESSHITAASGW